LNNNKINSENVNMSDEQYYNVTGLDREQFNNLISIFKSMKKSKIRTPRQAVGMLLMKLRTGVSDRYM